MLNTAKTVFVFIFVMFVAIRVVTLNFSDYYVASALNGDTKSIDYALSWNDRHDTALYLKGKNIQSKDNTQAKQVLKDAIFVNPTNMRALSIYATLLSRDSNFEKSDYLMQIIADLMPANKSTRLRSAAYWLQRGELDKSIEEWSIALSISPELDTQLFPILMRIADNDEARVMLNNIINEPPVWWDRFFAYMAAEGKNVDSLVTIAKMRRGSGYPLTHQEMEVLTDRLIAETRWEDAYLTWVESLNDEQRILLGSIYDGGFELLHNGSGFEWKITSSKHFDTRFRYVYDSRDHKSLHVRFHGREAVYKHLRQRLLLSSGKHDFEVASRSDMLTGRGRLKWFVRCADNPKRTIGESPSVIPSKQWSTMKFVIDVPAEKNCQAQVISLETTGKQPYDHKLRGNVWFDALRIRKQVN